MAQNNSTTTFCIRGTLTDAQFEALLDITKGDGGWLQRDGGSIAGAYESGTVCFDENDECDVMHGHFKVLGLKQKDCCDDPGQLSVGLLLEWLGLNLPTIERIVTQTGYWCSKARLNQFGGDSMLFSKHMAGFSSTYAAIGHMESMDTSLSEGDTAAVGIDLAKKLIHTMNGMFRAQNDEAFRKAIVAAAITRLEQYAQHG